MMPHAAGPLLNRYRSTVGPWSLRTSKALIMTSRVAEMCGFCVAPHPFRQFLMLLGILWEHAQLSNCMFTR